MMIKKLLSNFLALLFRPFPRNKHLWVTGKITSWEFKNNPPAFFDNSRYFFLYLVNHTDEKVYWLSSSDEEIRMMKEMGLPVVRYPSLKGIWLVLRAKFSFQHYGWDLIDYAFQRGSIQINLWHGTPIKLIGYDLSEQVPMKTSAYHDMMCKGGMNYISSTSKYVSEKIYTSAFGLKSDAFINCGYPRNDVLGYTGEETVEFCKKYSPELLKYIETAKSYSKVFLYLPTFREDDYEYFDKADIDFDKLSEELKKINGVFFIKLHPLTKFSKLNDYDNIIQISNDVDVHPFLIYTTHLVTDYSSIIFDYLMLDREMIFIPYDYDEYIKHRKFYFPYDDVTPGVKYFSFEDFINGLSDIDGLDYSAERKVLKDKYYDECSFDASEKTYRFIKERYGL